MTSCSKYLSATMYQCINKTYYTVQNHEKMIIKDLTNNYEKEIIDNHIQFIDCQKSSHPKYVWQYAVWTDTFCHIFKTEERIKPNSNFFAIETYTFTIDEAKQKISQIIK